MVMTAQQLADLMPDATQLESNEPEMESSLHYAQLALLVACLEWLWRDRTDFFIGANLTVYFSREQLKNRDFRGPDFFLVNQTQRRPRKSWVVWEEGGQYPNLIIELLSPATAKTDRSLKKVLYQDRFRTPEYFWFSPETLEFEGYRLVGQHYDAIAPNEAGQRWSEVLGLFLGVQDDTLRYFHPSGELVPTPEEAAANAQVEAQQTQERADRLAEQLKALGVEPEA
ncbi:MAG: Uma2 family endonuclease [Nodosilinea sp. WJT8-NPBG4]|jgi:Uma2 family endonuclease|nr:Uma2 family endonuclease [Nodosilinea sp. WJT8-NPBG4]